MPPLGKVQGQGGGWRDESIFRLRARKSPPPQARAQTDFGCGKRPALGTKGMFDRRLLQHFDWVLLLLLIVIGIASVLNLYSATYPMKGAGGSQIFLKQMYGFLLGIGVMLLTPTFAYHGLEWLAYPAY